MDSSFFSPILICAALGFFAAWAMIPFVMKISRRRAVEARHFEAGKIPVSRLGGLALAAGFVCVSALVLVYFPADSEQSRRRWIIITSSLAMFVVGLLDDLRPLGARLKLLAQVGIASAVFLTGIKIDNFTNPFTHGSVSFGGLAYFATVFWLVAVTNLINLVDGIDGLAGGISLMVMGLLTWLGLNSEAVFPMLCAAGMFGAVLGFLRYNFPPAKIYMGDGGAYFLGFLIGMLTLVHSQKGTVAAALIAPLFALAVPILDVSLAIVRRGVKGLPIFRPDQRHIHHKLLASGLSRQRTVLTLYALSLVCLLLAFAVFASQGRLLPILCGFLFLLLLVSARSLGLVRDWLSPDGTLSNVFQLRRETRYALCLARWLELEGERCAELAEIWRNYNFFSERLGFVRVRLVLAEGELAWGCGADAGLQSRSIALNLGNVKGVEFFANRAAMPSNVFDHLTDLAAEALMKASLKWEETHRRPISF